MDRITKKVVNTTQVVAFWGPCQRSSRDGLQTSICGPAVLLFTNFLEPLAQRLLGDTQDFGGS